jgi:uncharacterized protein
MRTRIVIDTNVYLSPLMRRKSVPSRALLRVWQKDTPLISQATIEEMQSTLRKPKFAKYLQLDETPSLLKYIKEISENVAVHSKFNICRHPKDDKFLELAVDGRADLILSGDQDLLVLSPFRGIPVVTPMQYLAEDLEPLVLPAFTSARRGGLSLPGVGGLRGWRR